MMCPYCRYKFDVDPVQTYCPDCYRAYYIISKNETHWEHGEHYRVLHYNILNNYSGAHMIYTITPGKPLAVEYVT